LLNDADFNENHNDDSEGDEYEDAISIPSSNGAKNDRETGSSLSEIPRLALVTYTMFMLRVS